jgi:hypothetical protein
MKTEAAKAIITKFFEASAQQFLLLLTSIECGRFGVEVAEAITPFFVYSVPIGNRH